MNFEQIEDALPNGFHDGFLKSIQVDYVNRKAQFELEVWVGSMEQDANERETYRGVRLILTGLSMCAVDIPNQEYLDDNANGLRIDSAPLDYEHCWQLPAEPIPCDSFAGCLYFTDETNSSITFVANDAVLDWITEARRIY